VRTTTSGQQVLTLGVATNDRWKDKPAVRIVSGRIPFCRGMGCPRRGDSKHIRKGNRVFVAGRVQTRSWETKDGRSDLPRRSSPRRSHSLERSTQASKVPFRPMTRESVCEPQKRRLFPLPSMFRRLPTPQRSRLRIFPSKRRQSDRSLVESHFRCSSRFGTTDRTSFHERTEVRDNPLLLLMRKFACLSLICTPPIFNPLSLAASISFHAGVPFTALKQEPAVIRCG